MGMTTGRMSADQSFLVAREAAPLRQAVTEMLRNAIATGRFRAGDRMTERNLCEMTGVSRTLIREALRQLESEGVIRVIAHRGPVVSDISPEQATGIYQVRELLEGLASELFARNATEVDRKALRDALKAVERAYETDDVVGWLASKDHFYGVMLKGSKNEALAASLSMLNARMTILRARSLSVPERRARSIRELEALMEHLLAGNPADARQAAIDHVRKAGRTAIASLRGEATAQADGRADGQTGDQP